MKVVVVYSGGLDSTVLLYSLLAQGHEVRALTIDYGQRHSKEVECAQAICEDLGVEQRTVFLRALGHILCSSLTSTAVDVPVGHYNDESMKVTVVPNRNMIMLSVAIGWAISLGYDAVASAVHAGDHEIYPDCRFEFVEALAKAAKLCHYEPGILLLSPFVYVKKPVIVEWGDELDVPFEKTWSCYKGQEKHCGVCGTCVERREAFRLAEVKDPTDYECTN